jgi:hypothetical protein
MGAGTSASTYNRQGATATCNVASLVGSTTISFRIRHKASLTVDFGDGTTQSAYNNGYTETIFSRSYGSTGNKDIKIRGCVNLISEFRTGEGGSVQTQPAMTMLQPEIAKLTTLTTFQIQDSTANFIVDTTKLPPAMSTYYNAGVNESYGSIGQGGISFLPATLTQFWALGSAEGHTGSISPLPTALQVFVSGDNSSQNFTGSINSLPVLLNSFSIGETNSTITGSIENLPLGMASFYIYGSPTTQTINGDLGTCLAIRPNLRSFTVRGGNTISCNFATFPTLAVGATTVSIQLRGNSTVSGNINQMTNRIRTLQLISSFNLSGDIANIPSSIESFYISGVNASIITGDIYSLNSKPLTTFLINGMSNHTVTGDLINIPSTLSNLNVSAGSIYGNVSSLASKTNLTNIQLVGTTGAITGDISLVGSNIISIWISGTNVNLSGNLSNLPTQISTLNIDKCSFTYPTTKVWPSVMGRVIIKSNSGSGLTTAEVDQLLIDLDTYGLSWPNSVSNREINLVTNNAARSATSNAAVASLIAKGVTVSTN